MSKIKARNPPGLPTEHTCTRQYNLHIILTQSIPTKKAPLPSEKMQVLALFLLAVSAGALPQPSELSPSETLTSTTSISSTAPEIHARRIAMNPNIKNFEDPQCHGDPIGDELDFLVTPNCQKFTPTNSYFWITWGIGGGHNMSFFSDDHCGQLLQNIVQGDHDWHKCIEVANLGKNVGSLIVP